MYQLNPSDEWNSIHIDDLWVYNKLFLSKHLGYLCGPAGTDVPYSGDYIVRPSINLLGMGRFSRIERLEKITDHLHPSEFWCEIFEGEHLSVDFYQKESKLVVLGERDVSQKLYKWKRWVKIDRIVKFPEILSGLKGHYDWINCEFIGNRLIEVHFRRNPDFRYGNSVAIPVWRGEKIQKNQNLTFISDKDYLRKGFYIDHGIATP